MASLTQGVLLKLLQHASDKDVKVTGEHRSALLQVIGIVPALSVGGDDPLQSRGFFLKVSDSLHSAYVSISDEDVDLIFSDTIQLGQFVHVSRFDSGSPLPVIRGIKPVPKRRPCVGNPTDLVSSDSLPFRTRFDFSSLRKASSEIGTQKRSDLKANVKRLEEDDVKSRRVSLGNGRVDGVELRRLSLDTMRRGWDQSSPSLKSGVRSPSRLKSKKTSSSSDSASVLSEKKASSKANASIKQMSNSPLKSKNNFLQLKTIDKPLKKDIKSPNEVSIPSHLSKVPVSSKSLSDQNILWDSLPSSIHDLGKDSVHHRNCSFLATVDALQEASAAESVIRCMSMFADMCESSQKDSAGFLVDQFLKLHKSMRRAATVVDALLIPESKSTHSSSNSHPLSPEACKNFTNTIAAQWVQAALETDLSKFSMFNKKDERDIAHGERKHYIVLENTREPATAKFKNQSPQQNKQSPINQFSFPDSSARGLLQSPSRRGISVAKKLNAGRGGDWSKRKGLKETASLAKRLLLVSREWFLKYLEDSLNDGLGLRRRGEGDNEIAALLGQLKRVNKWLEDATGDGSEINERIERLRKKLFEFLLEHVDSAGIAGKQRKS